MEKKLTILDRISLPSILKTEANYTTLIINKDIKKKVEITQDELIKYKFKTEGQNIGWSIPEGEKDEFIYTFTELEINEIKDCLTKLESEKKLTEHLIGLYELFAK